MLRIVLSIEYYINCITVLYESYSTVQYAANWANTVQLCGEFI